MGRQPALAGAHQGPTEEREWAEVAGVSLGSVPREVNVHGRCTWLEISPCRVREWGRRMLEIPVSSQVSETMCRGFHE